MKISKIIIHALAVSVLAASLWGCAKKEDTSADKKEDTSADKTHQLTIQLTQTTKFSRINFDDAYTMVWAGEVTLRGLTVGEFTAKLTQTIKTGYNGAIFQYDIIIPSDKQQRQDISGGPISDFMSIRTNHTMLTEEGEDHGVVFATSPEYRFLLGAAVEMDGEVTTITWETGAFPGGSPLAE